MMTPAGSVYTGKRRPGKFAAAKHCARRADAAVNIRAADGSRHPFDQYIIARTPADRRGTPEDLQGPAVFLASDASNFVNGHILYVDGGILAYIGKQP